MTVDTEFRIASMTKLATATAVLQAVEDGLVELDTPVGDVLPAFDELGLLVGFDGDDPVLHRPAQRATVRQLLAHTAGLAYEAWHPGLQRYHRVTGAPTLSTGARAGFGAPLVFEPGTAFAYSTSVDWAGLVVEAVRGRPLEDVYRERIFDPLGMDDTVVELSAEQRGRSAPVHVRGDDGAWVATDIDVPQRPEVYAGGHCLYSTPLDFLRLQHALLDDGGEVLSKASVDAILRNQTGSVAIEVWRSVDPVTTVDVDLGPGAAWGLGLRVLEHGRKGGWAGLFNTFYWIDRDARVAAGLYAQTLPFYDPDTVALFERFETLVSAG
jgi:CubicO group peptidase (beta-lactamase class C family)